MEKHKDVVAAVNVTKDLLSFVMAYRVPEGLGISAVFAVDADSEDTPLRELPDYSALISGHEEVVQGYKVTYGPIVYELKTARMGELAKMKLRNNVIENRLMQLAEQDRFLAIAINSSAVKKTNVLPFVFSVTENEYRAQQETRKKEQDEARRKNITVPPDLPAPDVLRDAVWYEKQRQLANKLAAVGVFASQKNYQYRNRVLSYMLRNFELNNGGSVDGVHALFSVLELAVKFGLTKKTVAQLEDEYMKKLRDRSGYQEITSYVAI
jgi:hypothetical protein